MRRPNYPEDPLDVAADKHRCPKCESNETDHLRHAPDYLPECWFWRCMDCEHEWGHT
jgi:hypothetical protein